MIRAFAATTLRMIEPAVIPVSGSAAIPVTGHAAILTGTPRLFGVVHLTLSAAAVLLAVFCALKAKRLSAAGRLRLISMCGWGLVVLEAYKQLFLFFVMNGRHYDWWFFPFQLCSVPMYMCILMPLLCGKPYNSGNRFEPEPGSESEVGHVPGLGSGSGAAQAVFTFLASYTFVGAVAALVIPEDFLRPYISLTLHGFIWHGLILFVSLTVTLSGMADLTLRSFARSTVLFLGLCVAAVGINVLVEPAMAAAHAEGLISHPYAAMFYLNPYHLSPQPLVDTVQKSAGIPAGLALYVLVIIAVSGITGFLFHVFISGRNAGQNQSEK